MSALVLKSCAYCAVNLKELNNILKWKTCIIILKVACGVFFQTVAPKFFVFLCCGGLENVLSHLAAENSHFYICVTVQFLNNPKGFEMIYLP